jgi:hypothetical protein
VLTDSQAQWLENEINRAFDYDPLPAETEPHHVAWFETQEKALARGRDPKLPPVVPHLHIQVPEWPAIGTPRASLYPPNVIV